MAQSYTPKSQRRRTFLKVGVVAGIGFSVGIVALRPKLSALSGRRADPDIFVEITSEAITIFAQNPEIGQGAKTSLPMIIAEELDADWPEVNVRLADVDPAKYARQYTVGSGSIRRCWDSHRQAGAAARWMLVQAAAARWGVDAKECATKNSFVICGDRRLHYTELAGEASSFSPPQALALKSPQAFSILGKRIASVDSEAMLRGVAVYGGDIQLPNMKHAVYVKCPARGGRVKQANLAEIKALPGVLDSFVLEGNGRASELMPGVAIVADSTWAALSARAALDIEWDETEAAKDDWDASKARARELQHQRGQVTRIDNGAVEAGLSNASKRIEALYSYEFVAHAQMEPMTCTARYEVGNVEIWAASQQPAAGKESVARLLGMDTEQITIHQILGGGGFGRRLVNDSLCEAAAIAQRVAGTVKLQWTREDDLNFDFFRPGGFHRLQGGLDDSGNISAWKNHFITFSNDGTNPVWGGDLEEAPFPAGYVADFRVEQTLLPWSTPCGAWRAPGSNVFAFVSQSFLHELAQEAGRDHLEFLLDLLKQRAFVHRIRHRRGLDPERAAGVLVEAAARAGWPDPAISGRALGLAFHYSHGGYVAQVAEVSVSTGKKITVHKVVVVADVGPIINLSGAEGQVEGSVLDGLSTMSRLSVQHKAGRISETNFHRYPLLRNRNIPAIEVHFLSTSRTPTGLGEPALPPLAPAVCNAVFSATGHRIRTLPIVREGFSI